LILLRKKTHFEAVCPEQLEPSTCELEIVGTYLRNLFFNWCVLIPLLAAFPAHALTLATPVRVVM